MADQIPKPVYQFPSVAGGITDTTMIPLARRSTQDDPEDLHFTPQDMISYLRARGFLVLAISGPYKDDLEAQAGGIGIGEAYELSVGNSYNMPPGLTKIRRL